MSLLGISFGHKVITIIEVKGKKILNTVKIQEPSIMAEDPAQELKAKVPDEVKIVALFNDELRRNKIAATEAGICLSGKDLIVRTFELPYMPANELNSAVNFEVKKYLPFKIEELISDFQIQYDRSTQRFLVLFVGIKKDILDKYLSILNQIEIKINSIDYSVFSILKFMKLAGVNFSGVAAVASADFQEEAEINFTVMDNGFPLFDRNISLGSSSEETALAPTAGGTSPLEKLKSELRISLEYYQRKYPAKKIKKTFLLSSPEQRPDLESFFKEIGQAVQFVEPQKLIGKASVFSLGVIKGYGCALSRSLRSNLRINLMAMSQARSRAKGPGQIKAPALNLRDSLYFFEGLRINPGILILGIAIFGAVYGYGIYRRIPLQKDLQAVIALRPPTSSVNPQQDNTQLQDVASNYKKKMQTFDSFIKKESYLTEALEAIPQALTQGVWITDFSYRREGQSQILDFQGYAYLADSNKEMVAVNTFLTNLKQTPKFSKFFKEINILSLNQSPFADVTATRFVVSCRS